MSTIPLGRLQKVSLRTAWASESADFTPWLAQAENLAQLGEVIGMKLRLEAQEQPVGPFRADIVCTNIQDDSCVLIENQLEQTDHTHLGQLLTYAAGLESVTIIWIAETFREEHRAALDWLNESTPEHINFFGIEIKLFRIADSPVAPEFDLICKPNQWTQAISRAARPNSEQSQFRYAYWSGFVQQPALAPILTGPLTPNRQGNLPLPTGWEQFTIQVYVSTTGDDCAVYLSCRGLNRIRNFELLHEQKDAIERDLGTSLSWQMNETYNRAWIVMNVPDTKPENREDWPRQQALLAAKTAEFYRVLTPYVKPLDQLTL